MSDTVLEELCHADGACTELHGWLKGAHAPAWCLSVVDALSRTVVGMAPRVVTLEADLEYHKERAFESAKLAHDWAACHDALLGFVQAHPDMLRALIESGSRRPFPSPVKLPPIIESATAVVQAWERLGKCMDEFSIEELGCCDEYRDRLDDAIISLKKLVSP